MTYHGWYAIKPNQTILVPNPWSSGLKSAKNVKWLSYPPPARAGYDTRSIFKQSLTGLNSEFSFS